ncbi:S49 family peptidase [Roseivirga seohaensis]|uniref:S49 family peptidase n=1 Tax=Roseivirga seohaensis TaxID=1914963 RepID=UPI003BABFAD8
MKRRLTANWQNLLAETIYNGSWMLNPIMAHKVIKQLSGLTEGNFDTLNSEASDLLDTSPVCYSNDVEGNFFDLDSAPHGVVAVIPLKGTMLKHGTWLSFGTLEIAAMIMEAAGHEKVIAIVIDAHSGGGSVDAVAPIHHAIVFAKKMKKPVIASVDMCASACIFSLAPSDYIVANNNISAMIGSIGVMWSYVDIIPMYEKEGVKFHEVYSSLSENKNETFRLALEGKYDLIKSDLLDPLAVKFQNCIKENRKGKLVESTPGLLKGKMFFAEEAKAAGLIDQVGDQNTAIKIALERAQINNYLNS